MDLSLTQLILYGILAFSPLSKLAHLKERKRKKKKEKITMKIYLMIAKLKKKIFQATSPPPQEKLSILYYVHQNLESRESICFYSNQSNQSNAMSLFTINFLIHKFFQSEKRLLVSQISPVEVKVEHFNFSLHRL